MEFHSADEIEQYMKENDKILIVYKDMVIDVTKFASQHPGGDVFEDYAGMDIEDLFFSETPHNHSKYAFNLMQNYCIGKLNYDTAPARANRREGAPPEKHARRGTTSERTAHRHLTLSMPLLTQVTDTKTVHEYEELLTNSREQYAQSCEDAQLEEQQQQQKSDPIRDQHPKISIFSENQVFWAILCIRPSPPEIGLTMWLLLFLKYAFTDSNTAEPYGNTHFTNFTVLAAGTIIYFAYLKLLDALIDMQNAKSRIRTNFSRQLAALHFVLYGVGHVFSDQAIYVLRPLTFTFFEILALWVLSSTLATAVIAGPFQYRFLTAGILAGVILHQSYLYVRVITSVQQRKYRIKDAQYAQCEGDDEKEDTNAVTRKVQQQKSL